MLKNVYSMPSEFRIPNSVWKSSAFELILLTNEPKFKEFPFLKIRNAKITRMLNVECWMCESMTFFTPSTTLDQKKKKQGQKRQLFIHTDEWIYVNCESLCWYHLLLLHCLALRCPTARTEFLYHWVLSVE